ncbi:MAG: GNAT family N-acetyltransferase [Bacteroidota bacterium]
MTLRPATLHDAHALAALSGQLGYPSPESRLAARLTAILGAEDHAVFVAAGAHGSVLGWIHVCEVHRVESDAFAEIGGLVVHEAHRRAGVGRRLVSEAAAWAAGRGMQKLRVRTRTDRAAARAFYASIGFSAAKQQAVLDKRLW